jgi:pyrimidine and pyridine-specific 5'-nucleotidase
MNCNKAKDIGWTAAHILEPEDPSPAVPAAQYEIRDLDELRNIFPSFFKTNS